MSIRQCDTHLVARDWDRYVAHSGSDSVVIEQFGDGDPQVWIHTSDDCERYSIAELVDMADL